MMNNNPDEKSEHTTIRFCLDDAASATKLLVELCGMIVEATELSEILAEPHVMGPLRCNSAAGPSPTFLAALTSLSEHTDYMLLPHSLHQIAEAYFVEEDFQFLQLEMLYHERLLSNLTSIHKDWESQWKAERKTCPVKICYTEIESKCISSLNHICRTNQRPYCSVVEKQVTMDGITVQHTNTGSLSKIKKCTEQPWSDPEEESEDEDENRKEDLEDLTEMVVQEEVARRQKLTGEELTEMTKVKETFHSNGLISILKKRKDSSPACSSPCRNSSKSKVRFSESDALLDNDEVAEDSCLFFLVLCLVTVSISMGGTMFYCFLGGTYSNICADFSHYMDFYIGFVHGVVDTFSHWFTLALA